MRSLRRALPAVFLVAAYSSWAADARAPSLPNRPDSVKFAVIGDAGTGDRPQYDVARQMTMTRGAFPFDLVLMLGDNFYGRQGPEELRQKFDRPYAELLRAGVTFQATLGNHDGPETRFYAPLNMHGQRYYTFTRRHVRFVVLDTNLVDSPQLAWLETVLREAREEWKICYFHHPLYSSAGRHGSAVDIRVLLEPLLVKYGVQVVWSGHDHAYERIKPQKGIQYFVAGSGGQLRKGDIKASDLTAAAFDQDQSFMVVEVAGVELYFQTISRAGAIVDSGVVTLQRKPGVPTAGSPEAAGAAGIDPAAVGIRGGS
jgi:predicted MPP superfamily phosphohydrolase